MGNVAVPVLAGALLMSGTTVTWSPFSSTLYPYSISEPSSFRHVIINVNPSLRADYFYPSLGSAATNVNISAVPGSSVPNEKLYLQSLDGHNIRRTAWVEVVNQRVALMCADFQSVLGIKYRIEQLTFLSGGMVWHLTASYDLKFKNIRSLMVKMLDSFKLRVTPRHR